MPDLVQAWKDGLPEMKRQVNGVGVWQALNGAVPVAFEGGQLVIGMPMEMIELSGHLRMPQTRRSVETVMSQALGSPVVLRVIEGTTSSDWDAAKRRDEESKRLQQVAADRARVEVAARVSWEVVYENLNRKYSEMTHRSLPQNRAKFFWEAIYMVAEARRANAGDDELTERNFARCIERVAQYSEIPSAIVAMHVLELLNDS